MDELVKRLRRIAVNERSESSYQDVMQAANAIEVLSAKRLRRSELALTAGRDAEIHDTNVRTARRTSETTKHTVTNAVRR